MLEKIINLLLNFSLLYSEYYTDIWGRNIWGCDFSERVTGHQLGDE
jgi:hypothetical protein